MKDIFVDDCVATRLENPLDPRFREFLEWLIEKGSPVLTSKILKEYLDSGANNFIAVIDMCQRDGRVFEVANNEMKHLRFTKKQEKNLKSNRKDWWHIKAILLSPRKLGLSFDQNFAKDVNAFPGCRAKVSRLPSDLEFK